MNTNDESFETAAKAFGLFSLAEKEQALDVFRQLRYPQTRDRFHEAVYRVVMSLKKAS